MSNLPLVFGFPRSGNHWLCSIIKDRFFPSINFEGDIDTNIEFVNWSDNESSKKVPWAGLMGGHYYDPRIEYTSRRIKSKPCIYLIRDGKDVMVSIWRLDQHIARVHGLDQMSFHYYLKNNLHHIDCFPKKNMIPDIENGMPLPVLWWWSTLLWKRCLNVLHIEYELLVRDLEKQINKISDYLKIKPLDSNHDEHKPIGILPSKQINIGQWKKHFNKSDLKLWLDSKLQAEHLIEK